MKQQIESLVKSDQAPAKSIAVEPKPASNNRKKVDKIDSVVEGMKNKDKARDKQNNKSKISKSEVDSTKADPGSDTILNSKESSVETFSNLGLSAELLKSILRLNLSKPTDIQHLSIPPALEGSDILASAETGSGKTIAYLIPIVEHITNNPSAKALIVTPTRELATQVDTVIYQLLNYQRNIKTAKLIGGERVYKQHNQLRRKPSIVVGTPGRILDHLNQGSLNLSKANFLVFDEADRILDMGFEKQITEINSYLPKSKQTLLFSATLPNSILKLASKYLDHPKRISVGTSNKPVANIKQEVINLSRQEKLAKLIQQVSIRKGSIIIFVKTKYGTDRLAKNLKQNNIRALALHGDIRHNKREQIMKIFREGKCRVLVATDLASRGLDIPHIEHVINYDLPQCPEDFIHRIGRTARGGAEGSALSFIAKEDKAKWMAIEKMIDPEAHRDVKIPKNNTKTRSRKKQFVKNSNFKSKSGTKKFGKRLGKGDGLSKKVDSAYKKNDKKQRKTVDKKDTSFENYKKTRSKKDGSRNRRKNRGFNRSKSQAA